MKSEITIEYCPKCGWLLRAAYIAQELLTTFEAELGSVKLQQSPVNGNFCIAVGEQVVFDRKTYGGFPEIKILKQLIRNLIAPGKNLGHADSKETGN